MAFFPLFCWALAEDKTDVFGKWLSALDTKIFEGRGSFCVCDNPAICSHVALLICADSVRCVLVVSFVSVHFIISCFCLFVIYTRIIAYIS
jgi:hypothetical protein